MPLSADLISARNSYLANADWEGDSAKALSFAAVIRRLLILLPARAQPGGVGGESLQFDLSVLKDQLARVSEVIPTAPPPIVVGTGFTYLDTSCHD